MIKKIFIIFITSVVFISTGFFLQKYFKPQKQNTLINSNKVNVSLDDDISKKTFGNENFQGNDNQSKNESNNTAELQSVQLKVPFVVQAPFGDWKDPIFQNACEESSIIMAIGWLNDEEKISQVDAKNKILDIVKFENETFGYNADTDVFDVQKIFKQKFNLQKVIVKEDVSLQNIIDQLQAGNLVLVPAFGQTLGNPNYTAPGPIAHMLVITGYDPTVKKFTTNDPGTRRGANYKYDENILFSSIWEYPSGRGPLNPPAKGKLMKAMIVIEK